MIDFLNIMTFENKL